MVCKVEALDKIIMDMHLLMNEMLPFQISLVPLHHRDGLKL